MPFWPVAALATAGADSTPTPPPASAEGLSRRRLGPRRLRQAGQLPPASARAEGDQHPWPTVWRRVVERGGDRAVGCHGAPAQAAVAPERALVDRGHLDHRPERQALERTTTGRR